MGEDEKYLIVHSSAINQLGVVGGIWILKIFNRYSKLLSGVSHACSLQYILLVNSIMAKTLSLRLHILVKHSSHHVTSHNMYTTSHSDSQ